MKVGMFKNILVPVDDSAMSRRAAARAVRLAREQKGRVTAIWVGPSWEPNLYAYDDDVPPGFISPSQHWANVRKLGQRRLAFVKAAAAAVRVPCQCLCVQAGFPFVEIVKTAKNRHCDLIVMGSHGRRGISRLLLGSVTSNVLAYSPVPVLVCR
jgi:nucleotide-binding universal stress UspA family protein